MLANQGQSAAQPSNVVNSGQFTIMKLPNGQIIVVPRASMAAYVQSQQQQQQGQGQGMPQPQMPAQSLPQAVSPAQTTPTSQTSAAPLAAPNPQNPMNVQPMQPKIPAAQPRPPGNQVQSSGSQPVVVNIPTSDTADFHRHVADFFDRKNKTERGQ